jgi:hypothetical protein
LSGCLTTLLNSDFDCGELIYFFIPQGACEALTIVLQPWAKANLNKESDCQLGK